MVRRIWFLLALTALLCTAALGQTPFIAVNGINGSDVASGLGWGQAVKTINKGIQRAQEHNLHEVWVIGTSYGECVIISGYYIELYGGFTGGESSRDQRNYVANVTTILGKCDDALQQYCPTVSIVNASNSVVDGFTITGGGGTMPPTMRYGGGFYITYSNNVRLHNDIITGNIAHHGGGIYALQSGLWVKDCDISDNIANEEGGGIFMDASSFTPFIEYCTLDYNQGGNRGGNILMDHSSGGWIVPNQILNGRAVHGAGIACYNASEPHIRENTISAGLASQGGGIYCYGSAPEIILNQITSNGASHGEAGGGIHLTYGSSSRVERNRIQSNTGEDSKGGGIFVSGSSPVITNNIIDYNTVQTSGGGMAVTSGSNVTLTGNTFAWNEAWLLIPGDPPTHMGTGGALWIGNNSTVVARNNIFYEDLAHAGAEVYVCLGCTYDHDYNDYYNNRPYDILYVLYCEDNTPDLFCPWGPHEYTVNPMFLDSDYHLQWDSFLIDKGDNNASGMAGVDYVDGDPRKIDGDKDSSVIVDIGADEYWPVVESVGDAKKAADNTPVLLGSHVVTLDDSGYYYVEDVDRVSGIRVNQPGHSYVRGDVLRVYGRARTDAGTYERYIEAQSVRRMGGPEDIKPLCMRNYNVGGGSFGLQKGVWSWNRGDDTPPWAEAVGVNNIGLLVRTCGLVTEAVIDPAHPENEYFYVEDGSMLFDNTFTGTLPGPLSVNKGLRVVKLYSGPLMVRAGMFVGVTGVSTCIKPGTDPIRLIKMRDAGDLTIYTSPAP
jgi:hypothetical protein